MTTTYRNTPCGIVATRGARDFCDQDMGYHDGHAVAILADFVETT